MRRARDRCKRGGHLNALASSLPTVAAARPCCCSPLMPSLRPAHRRHGVFSGGAEFTGDPEATATEALRLSIGRMWSHILATLAAPDGALHLYSGHDWTLTPLLMCITRHDDPMLQRWPPFCSELSVELWSTRGEDLQASGRGGKGGSAVTLSLQSCVGSDPALAEAGRYVRCVFNGVAVDMKCSAAGESYCSLKDFNAMVRAYAVSDFAAECSASGGTAAATGAKTTAESKALNFNK